MTERAERLKAATAQLNEALSIIEEDGGAAEHDGMLKETAWRHGLDHTISPVAMIDRLGAERDELAAIVRDHAASSPEEQIATIRVCRTCGAFNKAIGPLDFVEHKDACTWVRARDWVAKQGEDK